MEEQKDRVSFRTDKKSEAFSKVRVNKFGHITTSSEEQDSEVAVNLRAGGSSGVDAHVDIFDSPTMKKFMEQHNLNLSENDAEEVEIIDLTDEIPNSNNEKFAFERPESLEDFDKIADEVLGIVPATKQKTAEISNTKKCNSCNCLNKQNSKFCSQCGKPFVLAQFCKNCGNKFENQEKFCSECGNRRE